MEGDKGGIFIEAPDWKSLFLLKIKIKQNPGCPNKEYNIIFELFYQNIRVYPRIKKNLHWSIIGKILHTEESEQSEGLANKFPNTFGGSWGSRSNCYTNLLYKYEHFSFFNTANLIINWVPLSVLQTYCAWKTILKIKQNMKSRAFQKSWFSIFFVNLEKLRSPARVAFKNPKICE